MDLAAYWAMLPKGVRHGQIAKTLRIMTSSRRKAMRSHHAVKKQLILAMKLTAVLLLSAFLQVSATGYSQHINLKVKDAPLEKVFAEISRQSGYNIVYTSQVLQNSASLTVDITSASLEEALAICLKDRPLTYSIVEKVVVIKPVLPSATSNAYAPPGEIHGRITNAQGEPLANANVIIRRTRRGTQTNVKGEFALKNVHPDDVLTISFIGYKNLTVKVDGGVEFPLVMEVAKNELDKVVVQAYGTTTQRFATGNIATVTAEEIEKHPVANAFQALEGKVPGMIVSQANGYASAPFKVEIRGRNLISDVPSEPLYIIDGVPLTILNQSGNNYASGSSGFLQNGFSGPAGGQSPFFSINPGDIESITVLKDADATAIYGSRGANGVIIITTKKGKQGKTRFDLSVYHGIEKVTRHYPMLNTQQYLGVRREAFYNDSITYGITADPGSAPDLLVWDTTRYTDWQKFLWSGIGRTSDVQMSLSGGQDLTTFRIGAGYHREKGILAYSGADQRASIQFNLSHKSLNKRFSVSFTNTYSYIQSNLINTGSFVLLAPDAPAVFDSRGKLNYAGWAPATDQFNFGLLLQPYVAKTNFLNSQLGLKYELVKGLEMSANLGYSSNKTSQASRNPIASQNPARNPKGAASFGNNNGTRWIVEPQLEYKNFIGSGKLNVLIGGTMQAVSQDGNIIVGTGYPNDNLLGSISNAPTKNAGDAWGQYKYAAVFSRITYNLKNEYIFNLSARRDGSSRFGSGRQYGNFGALGMAWIFTEEEWIKKHLPFLSFGKLRASYGITGSDLVGDYVFLTRWSGSGITTYLGNTSYVPLQHANPYLQWQVNKKLEGALELGFLDDKLNMIVAYYDNRCGNQLVETNLPAITGFSFVSENSPALVGNSGWELTLRARILDKKDFNWSANFNIGINKNKLLSFPGLLQSPYAYIYFINESLNVRRLLHSTGVDPQTGLYTFEDKVKDGNITTTPGPKSDTYHKDMSPRFDGGFGTDISYKQWQLSLFFHFNSADAPSAIYSTTYPGGFANQSAQVLNRWQKPGDIARFARYTTIGDQTDDFFYTSSDGVYSNAFFIRLQNMSLSYDLSQRMVKKAGIQGCKIYLRGENLFLITKYNGLDPEAPNFGNLPLSKVFTGGIQINF